MKSMKTVVAAALSAGVCLLSLGLEAVTYTWKGGGTTNKWSDPTNWLVDGAATEGYPGKSDSATFGADCEATVDLDVKVELTTLNFSGPKDLTLTTSNGGSVKATYFNYGGYTVKTVTSSMVTLDAITFTMPYAGPGLSPTWSLHITGGANVSINKLLNYSTQLYQPQSVIRVDGGSTLSAPTSMSLGGFGVLEIEDATVTTPTLEMNAGTGTGAGGGSVVFKGTHPLLKVTSKVTSGSSATYTRGCDFRFVVPEEGFAETPLQVTGAMFSGLASLPRTCHYTVDVDSPFVTKAVPGTLTLATSGGTGVNEAHFAGVAPYVTRGEVVLSSDSNTVSFVQYPETGTLRITGEPMEYGDGYGYRYGLAENAALALSAPTAPSENLVCTGYRLFDIDAKGKRTEVTGSPFSGASCAYVHGKTRRELRWVWTKPKVYVSKTGSDENGGTSWDDAFASIQKAIDEYDYSTVFVGKGVYDVGTVVLAVTNGVELVGFGDGPGDVTFERTTTERVRILRVDHPYAVVTNVTVAHFRNAATYCTDTGGGVSLAAGTLDGCVISNCLTTATTASASVYGAGVNVTGGTVRNCLITKCTPAYCYQGSGGSTTFGGGVYMTDGLVENCRIRDCMTYTRSGKTVCGGGVYMTGGSLRGCLITGNQANSGGSGVYSRGGQIENCTIVANGVSTLASVGVYLSGPAYSGYAGEFINNIVRDNVDTTGINNLKRETEWSIPTSGLCLNNDSNVLITPEEGNITTDPLFHDDYRIGYSACVGAGVWRSWMVEAVDMDGNARLQGATPDLGCYAYVKSSDIICTFTAETDGSLDNAKVTLKADVVGDDDGVVYYWRVVRADGTVASDASGSDLKTLVLNLGAGSYDVRLAVTNAAEKGFVTPVTTGAAVVKASRAYVNATGSNSYPYDTLAKGAHDFFAAAEVVDPSGTVYVGDGRYVLEDTVNLKADAVHRVASVNGPANCVLQAGNASVFASVPFVQLVAADSCLAGCTVVGGAKGEYNAGSAYSTTHLVKMTGANAVVTNCVIRDGAFRGGTVESGLDMSAGAVVDVVIARCSNSVPTGGDYKMAAVALNLKGGLADRLCITNCWTSGSGQNICHGGIVVVDGGELRNALVANNSPSHSAAVYVDNATLANCTIVSNTCTDIYSKTPITGHVNTLCGGLIAASSAAVVNTIVSDNFSTFANAESNLYATAAFDLTYSAVPDRASLAGEGNVVTRPVFKSIARQDYHLKRSSAERLVGRRLDWMTEDSKDLDGSPRVCGDIPDMGCYENPLRGLMLLIR